MKTIAFTMIVLGLALVSTPVLAQAACQTSFTLVGKEDNKWHVGGETNPTLTVCPGQSITITATVESGFHNINTEGVSGAPAPSEGIDAGGSTTYTFTAPASGSGTYLCDFHKSTMKGTMNFAQTAATQNNEGDDKDSPGFGMIGALVALAGLALVLRRK